ncbi:chromatin-remodeling ATPase INO80-like isoform X2 [Lytechinus variegatus]|uniref:chromatin-remodeling ATPase INO80-like isoform X2 n=1 Tax=Lytechinus variegatus TaxID=7654 RepID=UPI001BB1429D|nr:chromatin-remodeling ATPase INO80-like isoform X2 [Lytechinus variegatus]
MNTGKELELETYRQGYLQRKKGVAKSVKKRWFCLNQDAFITFKTEEDAKKSDECLDVLPLVDVQTVKKQQNNNYKYYPFEIVTLQKTHVYLTDSAYEQDQWVKAFHNAMKLRSFNQQTADVTSKYSNGKDRRSSTGARKLSQIKKYMQDSKRSGQQRKSSGVECDPSETPDYQGIPIGNMDVENDDVFVSNKPSSSTTTNNPQTVREDTIDGGSMNASGKSRASDDSGQGSHDVRNLDSTSSANTASVSDGDVENGASKSLSNGNEVRDEVDGITSKSPSLIPPPVPAPASSGLSRSKKQRLFEDEQIYDEPPRIDEDIYDVPPREDEDEVEPVNNDEQEEDEMELPQEDEEEYYTSGLVKSSAMINLQKILDEDSDDEDDDDIVGDGADSEYDNVNEQQENIEAELTEKGVEKSAVEQLKDLLDSFDEL